MADELRADPVVLLHVGNALVNHSQSMLAVQQACHRDADDARHGWVGASAAALSALLDRWAADSAEHLACFDEHCDGLRSAAAGFTELERRNAASLR